MYGRAPHLHHPGPRVSRVLPPIEMLRRSPRSRRASIARLLVEKDLDDVQRLLLASAYRRPSRSCATVHDRVGQDLLEMPNRLRDQRS
jgi:hypothetical protein